MSKHPQSPSERQRALAACFGSAKLMESDPQVARSTFASDEILLADGRRLEVVLDVEPWVSKTHGLGWRMWLEPFICEPDTCERVFGFEVPRDLVQSVAANTKPIEKLFELRPDVLDRALRAVPGLAQALEGRIARNERSALRKASRAAPPAARRSAL